MSTTLRRPMFRGGGKIESRGTGITSGLDDRPGYQDGPGPNIMSKVESEYEKLQELKGRLGLYDRPEEKTFGVPEYLALAQRGFEFAGKGGDESFGQKLSGSAADFLGDVSTSIGEKKKRQREFDREMNLLKAGDIETLYEQAGEEELERIKAESDLKSKTYNVEITDALISSINQDIFNIEEQLKNTTDDTEKLRLNQQLKTNKDRLSKLLKGDTTFLDYFLRQDEATGGKFGQTVNQKIQLESALKILMEDPVKNKNEIEKTTQAIAKLERVIQGYASSIQDISAQLSGQAYKKGGRVGLSQGGEANMEMPGVKKSDMPSYDLLRSRLPDSISDEVVRLLSVSPQALADFSQIKTEQDIEDFNQTYQVNLTVPTVS